MGFDGKVPEELDFNKLRTLKQSCDIITSNKYNISDSDDCQKYYDLLTAVKTKVHSYTAQIEEITSEIIDAELCRKRATFEDFSKFCTLISELKDTRIELERDKKDLEDLYQLLDEPWGRLIAKYDYTDTRVIEIEVK